MSSLAVIIANPAAGSYKEGKINQARQLIRAKGLRTEVLLSRQSGEITYLARQSIDMSPEIVFVIGGDGTFNEAANGLVHSDIPIAFIPSGTTNVLAKELGVPGRIERAVKNALHGTVHRISLGKITESDMSVRYFIMMAGAGYDADTVYNLNPGFKDVLNQGAYIISGLHVLQKYNPRPITVKADGSEGIGYTVIVGNGSCYGGRFKMTPDASLFSPFFYVYVLKSSSRYSIIRTLFKLMNASHTRARDIAYFRTQSLRLEGVSRIQVDGDYLGTLPVDISIERECLQIRY